jgi:hypothetical protein
MDRRRLLALGGLTGAALLGGCSLPQSFYGGAAERPFCVARASLDPHRRMDGVPLVYEVNRSASRFFFEPGFFAQVQAWLAFYRALPGIGEVDQVWTYGSWIDGGSRCDSWHHAGRAFDLARLLNAGRTVVSCRYDQWRLASGGELDAAQRSYWRLAAGLHLHFAHVLTYLYDGAHHNHIHLDNGRSGSDLSTLSTRSRVQVQAVQAICRYVWADPVEITGRWDGPTSRAARTVLERIGVSGDLDGSTPNWHAFLRASAASPG